MNRTKKANSEKGSPLPDTMKQIVQGYMVPVAA